MRQANNDISVPDQINQAERWLAERGAVLVKTFVESGKSAKKDTMLVVIGSAEGSLSAKANESGWRSSTIWSSTPSATMFCERLKCLLGKWIERSGQADSARKEEIRQLRTRLSRLESESANVIRLVRNGLCNADDPQIATELAQIATQKKQLAPTSTC